MNMGMLISIVCAMFVGAIVMIFCFAIGLSRSEVAIIVSSYLAGFILTAMITH